MKIVVKKRVVIVDDDVQLSKMLEAIIDSCNEFTVVEVFNNAKSAIGRIPKIQPDIILMDIEMNEMNGIEATDIIKRKYSKADVVMYSAYGHDEFVFEALKAGASGYILKGAAYHEIIDALRDISRGGSPMSGSIARLVVSYFHLNKFSPLSKRELQILTLMTEGNTYTQISEELEISKETAKSHMRNIYVKLNVHSKSEAISMAKKECWI